MDTSLLKTKRKKRKTRKCLDEIRKKSRDCYKNATKMQPNIKDRIEDCLSKKYSSTTSNLLKYNVLAKAVRSETVTRSVILNTKHKNINKILNINKSETTIATKDVAQCIALTDHYEHDVRSQTDEKYCKSLINNEGNSSDSLATFSPLMSNHTENYEFTNSANEEESLSRRPQENYVEELYEDLIDSITKYMKRNFVNLTKDDRVLKKTRKALEKIYVENSRNELENKICINNPAEVHSPPTPTNDCSPFVEVSSPPADIGEPIVENPMDYLRRGYMLQGHCHKRNDHSKQEMSHSRDNLFSPCIQSQNSQSFLSPTPEYNFFPHKLN